MALDRAWFNALVDDDGSGMTGSVWDKADIANLLNSVDAELLRLDTRAAHSCKLANSIALSWGSGVWAEVAFGAELWDPAPMHNPNESSIYLAGPGTYYVDAQCVWPESTVGFRGMSLLLSEVVLSPPGYQFMAPISTGLGVGVTQRMTTLVQVPGQSRLAVQMYQNSGVAQVIPINGVSVNVFRIS